MHTCARLVSVFSLFGSGVAMAADSGETGRREPDCAQLAESPRSPASAEALLSLAHCLEARGQIATASLRYRQALRLLAATRQSAPARAAAERIAALQPRLPRLTVRVSGEPASGQQVRLSGEVLGAAAWGAPFTVDPGEYELQASAPGRELWSTRVLMAAGEAREIDIPVLRASPPPAPVAAPRARAAPTAATRTAPAPLVVARDEATIADAGGWSRRDTALVAGGLGLASLGVGVVFGLRALSKRHDSDELCPTDSTCRGKGESLNEQAQSAARIADVSIALGLLGAGLGTYLWLSEPPEASAGARVQLGVQLGAAGGQLAVGGGW